MGFPPDRASGALDSVWPAAAGTPNLPNEYTVQMLNSSTISRAQLRRRSHGEAYGSIGWATVAGPKNLVKDRGGCIALSLGYTAGSLPAIQSQLDSIFAKVVLIFIP